MFQEDTGGRVLAVLAPRFPRGIGSCHLFHTLPGKGAGRLDKLSSRIFPRQSRGNRISRSEQP